MKETLAKIKEVWEKDDNLNNWILVKWLIEKQLKEIDEGKYTGIKFLNELADILIMTLRYLDNLKVDPKRLIFYRLDTRHKGHTREIREKYAKMFEEEEVNR